MNSKQLFEIALGDISPWQVVSIDFEVGESGNKELHIRLDFPAGSTFLDDLGVPCKAHDTNNHTWRHLNFFEHHCYLHARVPRIKDSGGSVKTVQVPWARRNTGFTLLFPAFENQRAQSGRPEPQRHKEKPADDGYCHNCLHSCYKGRIETQKPNANPALF